MEKNARAADAATAAEARAAVNAVKTCTADVANAAEARTAEGTRLPTPNRLELVFILDASGSMHDLAADTIGGFNSLLEQNRTGEGEVLVTTILFSDTARVLYDRMDIRGVAPLTAYNYQCRGTTALLDAVGSAVERVDLVQRVMPEGLRAERVLFAITTDGHENASRTYTYERVRRLIEEHREQGWEFLFIGANIDAAREAASIGIPHSRAADYVADAAGTEALFDAVEGAVHAMRCAVPLADDWKRVLEEDAKRRR